MDIKVYSYTMDIKLSHFTFDISSALVFLVSVGIGLYVLFELIVAYVKLFN